MAGRMNWTRVAKERVVRERGSEPVAPDDRMVVQGTISEWIRPKGGKAQKSAPLTATELAAQEKRQEVLRDRAIKKALAAQRKREARERQLANEKKARENKLRSAAKGAQVRAARRAEFENMLAAMTPEERIEFFERQQQRRPRSARREVVVERRSLGQPTSEGGNEPSK